MSVANELNKFGKYVVQQSRSNLTKKKKKDRGELYNGIKYEVNEGKRNTVLTFDFGNANNYWEFVDKGVKGVGGVKADGSSWKLKNVTNNTFKYTNKMPPLKALDGWVLRKLSSTRNEKGQFVPRKSIKFAVAKSIFHTGLETTNFFTKPFEQAFQRLPDDIYLAYSLQVEQQLKVRLKS